MNLGIKKSEENTGTLVFINFSSTNVEWSQHLYP